MKITTARALNAGSVLAIIAIIISAVNFFAKSSIQLFLQIVLIIILVMIICCLATAKLSQAVLKKASALKAQNGTLMQSEEKFSKAFHDNVVGVALWDEGGRFIDVNRAFLTMVEFKREELLGMTTVESGLLTDGERLDLKKEFSEKGHIINKEIQIKTKSGQSKIVLGSMTGIQIDHHFEWLTTLIDITEKKQAEEESKRANEDLHHLSNHLENVREEERINIAREIHDELGQQLTGLKMDIHWLNKRLSAGDEMARMKLSDALELINETIKSVNKISSNLRPYILDDLGLIAALEWQSGEVARRFEVNVNFVSAIQEGEIPENIKTGMFRIYQEALTNVIRHANASEVNSTLHVEDHSITLEVRDNGEGFNKERLSKKTYGLLGIKERTHALRGRYELTSEPGKGTTIWISIPLS